MAGKRQLITMNQPDSQQASNWAIARFYSFIGKDSIYNSGAPIDRSNPVKVKKTTVVSDILRAQIQHSKGSYLMTAELVLSSGDINYQALLTPGDHAVIWLGSDQQTFEEISNKSLNDEPCNHFMSGLKFVGRVNSVRTVYNTAQGGVKTVRYAVTLKGFSEFGTSIYYNPLLAPNAPDNLGNSQMIKLQLIYAQISKDWNDYFFSRSQNKANVQNIIDFFIDVFLGRGPRDEAKKLNKAVRSPNGAFLIPRELMRILGTTEPSVIPNYANILHTILGVQSYSNSNSFLPDINEKNSNSVQKVTNKELYGTITAPPDAFNNVQLWSLIQQVCNPSVNEIYTAIKPNTNNRLVPTFVARQIPFTSVFALGSTNNLKSADDIGTRFVDLPRWVIDPSMQIGSFNIGTSDSARFNFFQVYGTMYGANTSLPGGAQYAQIAKGNFQLDDIDVSRNGSRNMITTTLVDFTDSVSLKLNIGVFADLIRDWYGNGHLKLNGSLTLAGVQEPIAIGDNLELGGKLFHIEGITHLYQMEESMKTFSTTVDLSQGVLSNGHYAFEDPVLRENINQYGTGLEPGYTDNERYVSETPIVALSPDSEKKKQ